MKRRSAKMVALGGLMAALSLVIMCLGGMIPIATFACPMLCMVCMHIVVGVCGNRIAWAWYVAVAVLSMLLCPDKEAAAIFLLLGYYPIIKPYIDAMRLRLLWKLLLFNCAVTILYAVVMQILGLDVLSEDYRELGFIGLVFMLILGNLTFVLFDRVLSRISKKGRGR